MMNTTEKQTLTLTDLDAEAGFVLPPRETMLVTVVIGNLLSNINVEIDVRNVDIAAQICNAILAVDTNVTCEVQQ